MGKVDRVESQSPPVSRKVSGNRKVASVECLRHFSGPFSTKPFSLVKCASGDNLKYGGMAVDRISLHQPTHAMHLLHTVSLAGGRDPKHMAIYAVIFLGSHLPALATSGARPLRRALYDRRGIRRMIHVPQRMAPGRNKDPLGTRQPHPMLPLSVDNRCGIMHYLRASLTWRAVSSLLPLAESSYLLDGTKRALRACITKFPLAT
ncbi:hypothetical protein BDP55DRAFT_72706 [Colletotrichum godetiae]|uniref:Uncharacterized protein n=1 Tax=Colletotrichum godetiae TaxID=1209918 RepID=A0AAJ0EUR7_9PEZI|nr:uncharacterized protein BDP55DRAFT_72706 [Colletotrichum godetiae]KAK1687939.1 hypothetical protein BDP55DRAFT_72706 [Colletotrichum godetiae]